MPLKMRKICPPVKKASRNHFGCVIRATNPQIHSPPGELCGGKRHFHSEEPFALGLASGSCTSGTVSYWTCNLLHKLTTEHVGTTPVLYGHYIAAVDRNLKGPGHMDATQVGHANPAWQPIIFAECSLQRNQLNTLFALSRALATHSKKNGI